MGSKNKNQWTDESVKQFARIYCMGKLGAYKKAKKIEDKLAIFKEKNGICDCDADDNQTPHEQVKLAKALLKSHGYFVDNLWSVDDVQGMFDCDDDTAQEVLYDALTNENVMSNVWISIEICGKEFHELTPKK